MTESSGEQGPPLPASPARMRPPAQAQEVVGYERFSLTIESSEIPPALLAQYQQLGIEPAEMLRRTEREAERRHEFQKLLLTMEDGDRVAKLGVVKRGQNLAFSAVVVFCVAMVVGFCVAPQQTEAIAKIVGPAGLTGLVVGFIAARWMQGRQASSRTDNEVADLTRRMARLEQELGRIKSQGI